VCSTPGKAPENDVEKGRSATNMSVMGFIPVNILSEVRAEWNCMCWLEPERPVDKERESYCMKPNQRLMKTRKNG
jgi:hypothetical protein